MALNIQATPEEIATWQVTAEGCVRFLLENNLIDESEAEATRSDYEKFLAEQPDLSPSDIDTEVE